MTLTCPTCGDTIQQNENFNAMAIHFVDKPTCYTPEYGDVFQEMKEEMESRRPVVAPQPKKEPFDIPMPAEK